MQDEPVGAVTPQNKIIVTRFVGTTERYFTILGHFIYALLTGVIVLVTNTLLSFLDNVRQFMGVLFDTPNNVDDDITYSNELFIEQMERLEAESKQPDPEPEPTEETK